ncbi:phosphotransferase enzyme family-domain-containing protein [Ustulina deusta]|nr:phosphotransferase enzyme family-domain-containing protein [Ustulina deusta]
MAGMEEERQRDRPKEDEETPIDASLVPPPWLEDDPTCGLAWVKDGLGLYPTWRFEPTIESIVATLKIAISFNQEYDVLFLHEGTFSKLYDVSFGNQAFVMRVSLPVHPHAKTEAEVATLDWVRQHTHLPVPRVTAYDSSRNNPLGFEWILMTKIEGKPLSERWWSVTPGSKERVVKEIAAFSASTFGQPFRGGIGGIYKAVSDAGSRAFVVGERAGDGRRTRGPFGETCDWMKGRLRLASSDLESRLADVVEEDGKETLQRMLDITGRIERLMPKFIPSFTSPQASCTSEKEVELDNAEKTPVSTMLCHDGLSLDNILVNDDGILAGVVDWQCISCLPLHDSCQFPAFLQHANDRFAEPVGKYYLAHEDDGPHPAYFRDRKRYEMTRLRRLYIEEMMDRAPGFVDVWRNETSANLRDYEAAVQNCDNEFAIGPVEEWVEAMEHGRDPTRVVKRLHERLAG